MVDFAVKIDQLPSSFKKHRDLNSMKHGLWKEITDKINDAKEKGVCPADLDGTIVEIKFGLKSFDVLNQLIQLEQ